MYAKRCTTKGCKFVFRLAKQPKEGLKQVCPECRELVDLTDAKSDEKAAKAAQEG